MRGWVRQELNRIATGRSTYIRNVPGYDLAHQRGREAAKGFGYDYADPKSVKDHKLQHRLDDKGRANRLRPPESC